MEIDKNILVISFLITTLIFLGVILIGFVFSEAREERVTQDMSSLLAELSDIQDIMLMSEVLGNEGLCEAFREVKTDMDENLWELGMILDNYRIATEEFTESEFYRENKVLFNRNQATYYFLFENIKDKCNQTQPTILFFYRDEEECDKCNDQSFVLGDVNDALDEDVSVFPFDFELDLLSINALANHYDVTEFPCTVIDGESHCGIVRSKDFIINEICQNHDIEACN